MDTATAEEEEREGGKDKTLRRIVHQQNTLASWVRVPWKTTKKKCVFIR